MFEDLKDDGRKSLLRWEVVVVGGSGGGRCWLMAMEGLLGQGRIHLDGYPRTHPDQKRFGWMEAPVWRLLFGDSVG